LGASGRAGALRGLVPALQPSKREGFGSFDPTG
jgi:hypothetical protein